MAPRRVLMLALFLSYPLLVHLGVLFEQRPLQWLALQALFAAIFFNLLSQLRIAIWVLWLLFAAVTAALMASGGGIYALYVPPLALLALAFSGFAQSLASGRTPLVTQMAVAIHGELSPPLLRHTRQVTQLWAMNLAAMFVIALVLSVTGPRTVWSLFTNLINYLWMGAIFAGEYAYRRWRFPEHDRDGFIGYLRKLIGQAHRFRSMR
ncbi:hypothetical protein E4T66_16525 [Sinimarinibacterium sp. CAU 1509]|uniref:COG4648 family protein n=1 Tax=Sinimarinibacterium sp. CAU 1509 TaxID=2562283 RepID=UPI0010AB99E4|nr:hypothetical protein [Sinimarinibacterium sp. CAU 1509]TJY58298.1 hypothetical protein E4T66_16525 [Sinimarinibacterium sp. CAU 1509]